MFKCICKRILIKYLFAYSLFDFILMSTMNTYLRLEFQIFVEQKFSRRYYFCIRSPKGITKASQ
ncbi:hypothetical protein [Heliothis virescens ascovirus 3j]|uniref:Uncharacterized protein n=1 Tax=Heliothis virescens ascovirus 3j TaxID=1561067 RepID=A0A2Z5V6X1_9VIRU|nr:hypothetical protein [Heliothis virescens ascovirus 3j]